jgi:ribonuclease T2
MLSLCINTKSRLCRGGFRVYRGSCHHPTLALDQPCRVSRISYYLAMALFRIAAFTLFTCSLTACNSNQLPAPIADPVQQSVSANRAGHGANRKADPGTFDFYLLNLSWSPEFCSTHQASPECSQNRGFVVHGLWPQNNDGTYPERCSEAPGPADPSADTNLMPTASLVQHEWQTHGTCSGLDAAAYFATVRRAFHSVKLPSSRVAQNPSELIQPLTILDDFAAANPGFPRGSFALSCGNNRLTAIEVCFAKDLRPEACQSVRSCRANVIRITPQKGN